MGYFYQRRSLEESEVSFNKELPVKIKPSKTASRVSNLFGSRIGPNSHESLKPREEYQIVLSGILHLIDWVTCMPRDCLQQNGNVVWNCVLFNLKTEKKLDVIKNLRGFVL